VKRLLVALIASGVAVPALGTDVSASIGISQPGLYGQINIGDFPRPAVIYAQPVWVQRPVKVMQVQPIYLRVPPGHEKHWSKHCGKYGACGQPVYFVREDWYQAQYVPRYERQEYYARGKSDDHDSKHGHGKGKGHEGGDD
jgi:predicted DNA-binding transcriptional regulator AlpA